MTFPANPGFPPQVPGQQPGYPAQPGYAPQQGAWPQQPGQPMPGQQFVPQPNQGAYNGQPGQQAAPAGLNNPVIPVGEEWPEGDLPEQMGGARTTFLPGITTFQLPANTPQAWKIVEIEDGRAYLANGTVNPTGPMGPNSTVDAQQRRHGMKVARLQLKYDRNIPLVALDGKFKDHPFQATFNNNPRARGKKDDPKTPWISDLAYITAVALQDPRRPTEPAQFQAIINEHAAAGHTIRLEHGLTGQCRDDKVRYILPFNPQTRTYGEQAVADPSGKKGCGKRFYTKDFQNQEGGYDTKVGCSCGLVSPQEFAAGIPHVMVQINGYESVERIMEPLAPAAGGPAPAGMQAPQGMPQGYAPPQGGVGSV